MRRFMICSVFLTVLLLLFSCNASILMNNGEITVPDTGEDVDNDDTSDGNEPVVLDVPRSVNATKSFYSDKINVTWSPVTGADYYTIEKCEHEHEKLTGGENWIPLQHAVFDTSYSDCDSLQSGRFYSYRITAHTFEGAASCVSSSASGTILSSPQNVNASRGTSETSIDITWEEMPYVDMYRVYMSRYSTIAGVESEVIATVAAGNGSTNAYTYTIDQDTQAGAELSFAVQSVSEIGSRAEISLPRTGYTRVQGAPLQPVCTSITKGDSLSSVTMIFEAQDADADYVIKKYYPGGSEEVVLDTEAQGKDALSYSDGRYSFTDTLVINNVEYTYLIIAKNDKGPSPATEVTGYLLSPVSNMQLVPVNDASRFGYVFSYNLPAGSNDEERENEFIYHVSAYAKDGSVIYERDFRDSEVDLIQTYYEFDRHVDEISELKELERITIKVGCSGLSSSEVSTNRIAKMPSAIAHVSATCNDSPLDGDVPNSYGVYPVHISWIAADDGMDAYVLYRKDESGNVVNFNAKGTSYTDETTSPLVRYEYWIASRDELGRTHGEPHFANAYGSITLEAYKVMFESISLKPWEIQDYVASEYRSWWKNTEIAKMIEKGNSSSLTTQLEALGSASASDHYRGGVVTYNAKRNDLGGLISFTYSDFGENANFWINGAYTMDVNASGTGSASSSSGGFDVSGMYPGHFGLEDISVNSKRFTGRYTVTYNYSDGHVNSGKVGV